MELSYNFWENMTFFLGGVVIAGVLAAVSQVVNLRSLSRTKLRVCVKKENPDGK